MFPHPNNRTCPAKGKECHNCHKKNHFASVCLQERKSAFQVTEDAEESTDCDNGQFGLYAIKIVNVNAVSNDCDLVKINTDFGIIGFNPDTGADATLIDPSIYKTLNPKPKLLPAKITLLKYGDERQKPMRILGCFDAILTVNDQRVTETIYVTELLLSLIHI